MEPQSKMEPWMKFNCFAKNVTVIMASLATLAILTGTCSKASAAPTLSSAAEQKQLGDLDIRALSGEQVSLIPYITHKAVVVVFWAAWCPICRAEAPRINRLDANPNVKVIAVNEGDTPKQIAEFLKANKVGYQVVVDPVSDLAKAFGVPGMPYCAIIGRSGTIVYRGYKLPENIDDYIK